MRRPSANATAKSFGNDLRQVKEGSMSFDKMARSHRRLIHLLVNGWTRKLPAHLSHEDVYQEALIELWRTIQVWDPAYGVPIERFARYSIQKVLHSLTSKCAYRENKFFGYLQQQIVEERVMKVLEQGSPGDEVPEARFIPYTTPSEIFLPEVLARAQHVAANLTSAESRIFGSIFYGTDLEVTTDRVYGRHCKRPRKATVRAVAKARELVKLSVALQEATEQSHGTTDESSKTSRRCKPIANTRQREQSLVAC